MCFQVKTTCKYIYIHSDIVHCASRHHALKSDLFWSAKSELGNPAQDFLTRGLYFSEFQVQPKAA